MNTYDKYIDKLTLDKIPLKLEYASHLRDLYPLDLDNFTLEEVFTPLSLHNIAEFKLYSPDYAITGYFQGSPEDIYESKLFTIDPNGPHILYVTGMSKKIKDDPNFRLNDPLWVGYWEDNRIGYLFQIIDKL